MEEKDEMTRRVSSKGICYTTSGLQKEDDTLHSLLIQVLLKTTELYISATNHMGITH